MHTVELLYGFDDLLNSFIGLCVICVLIMDTVLLYEITSQFFIFFRVRGSECVIYEELVTDRNNDCQTEIETSVLSFRLQHVFCQRIASFKYVLILLKGYSIHILQIIIIFFLLLVLF